MRITDAATILAIGLGAGCSSAGSTTPVTGVGYTVTLTTGPSEIAPVGTSIPIMFTVTENESDHSSRPARGKSFSVAVTSGGGTVNGAASTALTTATDGSVSVTWILGPTPGTQAVRGLLSSSQFRDVSVLATTGPAAQLKIVAQPSQIAQSGVVLPAQPAVQIEDAFGNQVTQTSVPVTASITAGGGTIGGTLTVNSNAAGLAAFTDLSVSGGAGAQALRFVAMLNGQTAMATSAGIGILWTTKASMPTPRLDLGVGVVNGIIYAVGGYNGSDLGTVEAYDPATNSWTTKASMPTPRSGLSVGVVNGILYAVGGIGLLGYKQIVEAYDPATDTWTTKASLPAPTLDPSIGVVNGILYVVGGDTGALGGATVRVGTVTAYDPATNSWTTRASMPTPRDVFGVGVVSGILYAVGGTDGTLTLGTVEAYDPATNSWTTKAPMPLARENLSVGVTNGVLHAVGGNGGGFGGGIQGTVETYDPATNSWTTAVPTLTPRQEFGLAVVNGILYAVGGATASDLLGLVEASSP